jgi:hypothetical protein
MQAVMRSKLRPIKKANFFMISPPFGGYILMIEDLTAFFNLCGVEN